MTDHFSAPQERSPLDAVLAVRDEVGKVVVGQQGCSPGPSPRCW
ncbi:MAG: hypothetical protein R2694_02035 [Ilumatobacteraceae bacterium]